MTENKVRDVRESLVTLNILWILWSFLRLLNTVKMGWHLLVCWRIRLKLFFVLVFFTSLLNKVPRVHKCPSAQVPEYQMPWVSVCPSARVTQVRECPSALSTRVPFKCLSVEVPKCPLSTRVSKCLECPSAHQVPECPSALSARVPLECLSASSARVSKCLECPSAQLPFKCPSVQEPLECLRVPLECPLNAKFPLECSLS